uniref:Uncharacterized protein n=1 Tax=Lepeophtheirus salmonis TaxID=72036 RepID=A0A0K2ULZ6_LEPSM
MREQTLLVLTIRTAAPRFFGYDHGDLLRERSFKISLLYTCILSVFN